MVAEKGEKDRLICLFVYLCLYLGGGVLTPYFFFLQVDTWEEKLKSIWSTIYFIALNKAFILFLMIPHDIWYHRNLQMGKRCMSGRPISSHVLFILLFF